VDSNQVTLPAEAVNEVGKNWNLCKVFFVFFLFFFEVYTL